MFKKRNFEFDITDSDISSGLSESGNHAAAEETASRVISKPVDEKPASHAARSNTILKGSKLIGDINVTTDLELSGDVEGNIKSEQNSNIVLKGNCKGNIETREGSVAIDGSLEGGNIIAGKDVTIIGRFKGGEVKAQAKIYVNGEFDGTLEGNEIEIGPDARGKGELIYREYVSISRGAKVEVSISKAVRDLKVVKEPSQSKVPDIGKDKKNDNKSVKEAQA